VSQNLWKCQNAPFNCDALCSLPCRGAVRWRGGEWFRHRPTEWSPRAVSRPASVLGRPGTHEWQPACTTSTSQVKSSQVAFNKMKVTSAHTHTHTHTHPFNGLCPGLPGSAGTRKVKPMISLKQETVSGSGISRAVRKSAPRSRQITTLAPPPLSFFTGRAPFLPPNQRRQSIEGIALRESAPLTQITRKKEHTTQWEGMIELNTLKQTSINEHILIQNSV